MCLIRSSARTVPAMAARVVIPLLLAFGLVAAAFAGASGSGAAEHRTATGQAVTPPGSLWCPSRRTSI
jgi:hypothetical protein